MPQQHNEHEANKRYDMLTRQLVYLQDENDYLKRDLRNTERRVLYYKITALILVLVQIALMYMMMR